MELEGSDLITKLNQLLETLEDNDSEEEDMLFAILENVRGALELDLPNGVADLISQYDFEAAAEALRPVISKVAQLIAQEGND